jgi:putative transposase
LVQQYAVICIEDLNLDGMKHLWGRKVSDLAYGEFIQILEWVARKNGSIVVKVDRWLPSSKTCHICGTVNTNLTLTDRRWTCEGCGATLDRDTNAAINIREAGLSLLTA